MRFTGTMMMMMMIMWAFTVVTVDAQPRCDPITQYAQYGECCNMCGPGTSMTSISSCLEPHCQKCEENEYQDKHSREPKCQRQPFCDPNRNFLIPVHKSDKRSVCQCKEGFHCSSQECITCVPHTTCKPGYGVRSKGSHSQDTVCQKCPNGTYSDENSSDGICKKWTQCGSGQYILTPGKDTSDNICARRTHLAVILVLVFAVLTVAVVLTFYFLRGERCHAKRKVKSCVESCLGVKPEQSKEAKVLMPNPTDPADFTTPEPVSSQEEGSSRLPEENEDEPSQEMSTTDVLFTERGNYVTQENGKSEILSRQESQTQTFTG